MGRFLQPDPAGFIDGLNIYNYVGGDPVNFRDPSGLTSCDNGGEGCDDEITVTGDFGNGISDGGSGTPLFVRFGGLGGGGGRGLLLEQIIARINAAIDGEIFSIGERRSDVFTGLNTGPLPFGIDLFVNGNTGHFNSETNLVCNDGSDVSDEQLSEIFNLFIVPRSPVAPVEDGATSLVTDPRFRSFTLPGGFVTTTLDGPFSGTNTTTTRHFLFDGTVTRSTFRTQSGGIAVSTIGQGTNRTFVMAALNASQGPRLFRQLDRQFATILQDQFESCRF